MRLDQFLAQNDHAPSRTKAQEMISSGAVLIFERGEWQVATSASQKVQSDTLIKIIDQSVLKYVSRGGLKLEGALQDFKMDVSKKRVFDIGQSTGGFTDCVLQLGASAVLGVDVGHGQLHPNLKNHKQILALEGVHIDELHNSKVAMDWLREGLDLCVIDVSFISIVKVFEALSSLTLDRYEVLGLVKPQFEVGRGNLSKSGLVKDAESVRSSLTRVEKELEKLGFQIKGLTPSQIKGGDGNQEYWLYVSFKDEKI